MDQIDIFVSFSSRDRDKLVPIVWELRNRGLKVWWSEDLLEGRWDTQIRTNLDAAQRVIGIVSDNAEDSARDYIFEELELARQAGKLIPVIIGEGVQSFAFRGVIALLQSYFFESIDSMVGSPAFEKLVFVCGGRSNYGADSSNVRGTPEDTIDRWYTNIEEQFSQVGQIHAFSLSFAVSIFENGPLAEVENLSHQLTSLLTAAECPPDAQLDPEYPRRAGKILELIECEKGVIPHPIMEVDQILVRFQDPERAPAFIQFAWTEFGSRRSSFLDWWQQICEGATAEGEMRLGFALGMLAQKNFIDVFELVIKPWLFSESKKRASIADIALSVAAFDPAASNALKKTVAIWADRGTQLELRVAARLACGFSGTRVPGLALETLRVIASKDTNTYRARLIDTMSESLAALLDAHAHNSDNSLYDLAGLINELAQWVTGEVADHEQLDSGVEENPIPLRLFLSAIDDLPMRLHARVRGTLSLGALVANHQTAQLTARVFNAALSRHRIGDIPIREPARMILLKWISVRRKEVEEAKHGSPTDPLLILGQQLVATARTENDVERVVFMFDGLYQEELLRRTQCEPN